LIGPEPIVSPGESHYHREPTLKVGYYVVNDKASDVAKRIADELASCGVKLVASLPDNWLMGVIKQVERDDRFVHVPVNREESAVGLCSGAYMGAMGSAALMGASGFMTVIYAITKINYTYEIPLFLMLTLRGVGGDHHKHHISNGLYLRPVLDAINMPYQVIDDAGDIEAPYLLLWAPPPSLKTQEPAHHDIVGRIERRRAHSHEHLAAPDGRRTDLLDLEGLGASVTMLHNLPHRPFSHSTTLPVFCHVST